MHAIHKATLSSRELTPLCVVWLVRSYVEEEDEVTVSLGRKMHGQVGVLPTTTAAVQEDIQTQTNIYM